MYQQTLKTGKGTRANFINFRSRNNVVERVNFYCVCFQLMMMSVMLWIMVSIRWPMDIIGCANNYVNIQSAFEFCFVTPGWVNNRWVQTRSWHY
jgi:hypothetical protein